MSEITNYTTLAETAKSSLGRDLLPGAITLVTADINKLRLREMLTDVSQSTLDLPADFLEAETVKVGGVTYVPSAEMAQARGASGTFSVQGSQLLLNPADSAPELVLRYYARVSVLSGTDTNDILTNYPEIYLFGVLARHAQLARDEAAQASWGGAYAKAIEDAEISDAASLMSSASMPAIARASA